MYLDLAIKFVNIFNKCGILSQFFIAIIFIALAIIAIKVF